MSGFCKYYKQKKQVSYDGGQTWQDIVPAVYQKGVLYETDSLDCGYQVIERWVTVTGYICDGTTKCYREQKQVSYDGGQTWNSISEYRKGSVIEYLSTDCGYVPSSTAKIIEVYSGGTVYSAECDSNTTLTSADTKPLGYDYSGMTSAEIGDCITSIGTDSFWNCISLSSVTIPNTVTSLGGCVFQYCNSLKSLRLPNNCSSIGATAFYGCTSLESITNMPDILSGQTEIYEYTFYHCHSLTTIKIPNNITIIANNAFGQCYKLDNITIPSGVTTIGNNAFINCSGLTSINIPDSVTTIGNSAFWDCVSLSSCTIGSGLTSIGNNAFTNCYSLSSIDIPDSVTSIGGNAFIECASLSSCTIGNGVKSIGIQAFLDCGSLTSCTIGSGVTSIGYHAFGNCSGLTSITINATTPPTLETFYGSLRTFENTNNCPIYVPAASVNAYKSASGWSTYASRIQAIP